MTAWAGLVSIGSLTSTTDCVHVFTLRRHCNSSIVRVNGYIAPMLIKTYSRLVFRTLAFFSVTAVMTVVANCCRSVAGQQRSKQAWLRLYGAWARMVLWIFSVKVSKDETTPIDEEQVKLVFSNHSSPLDIAVLVDRFGGRFVAQIEMQTWPVIGFAAKSAGAVFVDRGDPRSGFLAIAAIREILRFDRDTVVVFPESVASQGDEVLNFHRGGFLAARNLDVLMVPVGLAYQDGTEWEDETFLQHLRRVAVRPDLAIGMCVGQAYKMQEAPDLEAEKARGKVKELILNARKLLNGSQVER